MSESFDRDPLILLHDVARTMRTRFDQKARATHAMTRAQWIILSRLQRQPGMSQNEMAAICEVEPITVARLVDRLEARGLVERRNDPADRRIRRLHLLPAADPILQTIHASREFMNERITAGLDAKNAFFGKRLHAVQDQRVFLGVDVVGDDRDRVAVPHRLAEHLSQGGFARADRSPDPDTQRAVRRSVAGHVRNTREYCSSWRIEAMSERIVAEPRSSSVACSARRAVAAIRGWSAAKMPRPAV